MWLEELDIFLKKRGIFYKEEEPLFPYTTIKIGGKAQRLVFPEDEASMIELLNFLNEREIPYFVMGGGSNLLVSDEGFKGVVVHTSRMKKLKIIENKEVLRIYALSGVRINQLIRLGYERGFGGFEFLAGVPATVGGAIRMNAGAFGLSTSMFVKKVKLYHQGKVEELTVNENLFTYRSFKREGIILSAEIELKRKERAEIRENLKTFWEKRRRTQPVSEKTFGSVFKNPPCCYAGALIEQTGLKGYRIGGAKISEKHANFIVNIERAKAEEVLELIKLARKKVYERFGILLEPEVNFLGIRDEELA